MPPSQGFGNNQLNAVSCTSSTSCVAVGQYYNDSNDTQTLGETWNGNTWSVADGPDPGAYYNDLTGVSCTSPTFCVAVGFSSDGDTSPAKTLIETWNGVRWSTDGSPDPTSFDYLAAVSCSSSTSCVAVGDSTSSSNVNSTLVETLSGTSWSVQPSANPASDGNQLNGVSCTSSSSCVAVGNDYSGSGAQASLAEWWNGTKWAVIAPPDKGSGDNILEGVSCASSTSCVAVGSSGASVGKTLIDLWNGSSWSIATSPNPSDVDNYLSGASCISSGCIAVGTSYPTSETTSTLIESSSTSAPSPTITSFTPTSGPPGTKVTIKGTNLESAENVTFGGTTATIIKDTATALKVEVPKGAKTGKITVTTPDGSVTSTTKFRVTKQ